MAADKRRLVKLILQWTADNREYRLLAKADSTPGYEDTYLVEACNEDGYGDPRWDVVTRLARRGGSEEQLRLVDAIRFAVALSTPIGDLCKTLSLDDELVALDAMMLKIQERVGQIQQAQRDAAERSRRCAVSSNCILGFEHGGHCTREAPF